MRRNLLRALPLVLVMPILAGCLDNKALQPVAQQNEANLAAYTQNNEVLYAALRRGAAMQVELQVHSARGQVSRALALLRVSVPPNATLAQLSDPSQPCNSTLQDGVDKFNSRLKGVPKDSPVYVSLRVSSPGIYDIATEAAGFTVPRVLHDSVLLDEMNVQIERESDAAVREAFEMKRAGLLDQYAAVKDQLELGQAYLEALDTFIAETRGQGQVALMHAKSVVAYSRATPAASTLLEAAGDEELRSGVLGIVATKKGQAFADRLKGNLEKSDKVINILRSLNGQ
jgi:hypothetical protein